MTTEQLATLTPGRTQVRDHHGTVWVFQGTRRVRLTGDVYCSVRCVMPAPDMRGLSVGCISERPACVLEVECVQ